MDEQILQAYQMNTNTFSDLSVCLMGLALNNVQNETTCKGKWKMTASFVIVLHNILLILFQFLCARYFSFDLEVGNRKYRHKKTPSIIRATSDAVQNVLIINVKYPNK